MLTNAQIKSRELYKATQNLIKILGNFKKAQQDLLLAMNECALAEICHFNAIKKGVVMQKCKWAIKHYIKVYGDKFIEEEHIEQLKNWQPNDEKGGKQ